MIYIVESKGTRCMSKGIDFFGGGLLIFRELFSSPSCLYSAYMISVMSRTSQVNPPQLASKGFGIGKGEVLGKIGRFQ